MRRRLDTELVRRGLARSRAHATELVTAGAVKVDGRLAAKVASQVDGAQAVTVDAPDAGATAYVSRGGVKLAGALDRLGAQGPVIEGAICLDAGASTGGFTDVLLRRGAAMVHAVDVGYGQLAWSIRQDPRVKVMERTNVRYLVKGDLEPAPGLVVADLSFISLTTVLPALVQVARPEAAYLLMVKPQFEVGRADLPSGGVVRDQALRRRAVENVVAAATGLGLTLAGTAESPLPGPKGNVEHFVYLVGGK
jgi:23S rRNA (cytidine1920-2'-O)/16S rRNA (cytidine1409-2'-O)-methyltransferase